MRKFFQWLLLRPVMWGTAKFSSRPEQDRIFKALSKLYQNIILQPGKKGLIVPFDEQSGKFIIFSDQHKGARNGADDFAMAEPNYLAALDYYNTNNFFFISLADNEEHWENTLTQVKKYNTKTIDAEQQYIDSNAFITVSSYH